MKNYKLMTATATVAVAVAGQAAYGQLTSVNAGSSSGLTENTGLSLTSLLGGGTIVGTLTSPFFLEPAGSPTGLDTGTITSYVVENDSLDTLGVANELTFIYQVSENSTSDGNLSELQLGSLGAFYGPKVQLGVQLSTYGSNAPLGAYNVNGIINFVSNGSLDVALTGTNNFFVVGTSDTSYGGNSGSIQDGGAYNAPILAPVPEANTIVAGALMLLPLGIGAIRAIRKERTA
jgi:hypothetical protein